MKSRMTTEAEADDNLEEHEERIRAPKEGEAGLPAAVEGCI